MAGTPTKSSKTASKSHGSGAKAHPASATKKGASSKKHSRKRASWRHRGQQQMQSERVRDIQLALIRERYLDGEPTGLWDDRSKLAMTRYQSENGWQTKTLPDSRALIKLGLGPNHAGLMNPESLGVPGGGAAEPGPGASSQP